MKKWVTEVTAVSPTTGELTTYFGDIIEAPNMRLAQEWCELNERGYLKVIGELICEVPCKPNSLEPDWDNAIDYGLAQDN